MARRYNEIGKLDQVAMNSMATADLRATDALDAATALNNRLVFEENAARNQWRKVVDDLGEAHFTIERGLESIKLTRQIIADGKFLR